MRQAKAMAHFMTDGMVADITIIYQAKSAWYSAQGNTANAAGRLAGTIISLYPLHIKNIKATGYLVGVKFLGAVIVGIKKKIEPSIPDRINTR